MSVFPRVVGVVRELTPPLLWRPLSRLRRAVARDRIRFTGSYPTWVDAEAASDGYDSMEILQRVIEATRRVEAGDAAYERDGVAFLAPELNYPLAFALARCGLKHGRIHVVDFGGSLGSTYRQLRAALGSHVRVRWAVVEQPHYVEAGRREFTTAELSFHASIEDAVGATGTDIILLSGVLQCLPQPEKFLDEVIAHDFDSVILDRTAFMASGTARLTVQHVPPAVHAASYPAWFLSQDVLVALERTHARALEWPALDDLHPDGGRAVWRGFAYDRRPPTGNVEDVASGAPPLPVTK